MIDLAATSGASLSERELRILKGEITRSLMTEDIVWYSGFHSRHVGHEHNLEAASALLWHLHTLGGGRLWVRPQFFQLYRQRSEPMSMNVEAMLPGVNSSGVVIISAHLDCTAERDPSYRPARDRAPGADDDASGIAGVLAAARAILELSAAQRPGEPRAEIRFVLFNAEEQGQRGSRIYAKRERQRETPISAVYQMDMIGYRTHGDTVFQLHVGFLKDPKVELASRRVANDLVQISEAAGFDLKAQVYTSIQNMREPGQGFSDHTSFHRHGFPAVMVSENFFPPQDAHDAKAAGVSGESPNPDYHLPEDEAGNLDVRYAVRIARAVTAAAWHRATRRPGGSTASYADHETAGRPRRGGRARAYPTEHAATPAAVNEE